MDRAPSPPLRPEDPGADRAAGAELRIPADSLRRLSRLCGEPGGGGVPAVREAGRTAGRRLIAGPGAEERHARLQLPRFWSELREAARERGWGDAAYRVLDDDLGEVTLRGSPEAAGGRPPAREAAAVGCHFAVGWIGGALSAAAGEPVAVLEVSCGADSEASRCRFLVGAEARLRGVLASLRDGASVEEALAGR